MYRKHFGGRPEGRLVYLTAKLQLKCFVYMNSGIFTNPYYLAILTLEIWRMSVFRTNCAEC